MASFFDHPYYIWNKRCLSIIGTWPEQSFLMRCALPFVVSVCLLSILIPEMLRLWTKWRDADILMDCISSSFILGVTFVQLFNGSLNRNRINTMLERIKSDWKNFGDSPNIEIIRKFAARGCLITKIYSVGMYFACTFYVAMPCLPVMIDVVFPLNESRQRFYLYEAEYGFESNDEHYWTIFAHSTVVTYVSIVVIISSDVMYFAMVEHGCGLFEVVRMNLESIDGATGHSFASDQSYKIICNCVHLHRQAIIFAELIESCYTASFVGVIGFCIIILSISGVQVVMHLNEPEEVLRYGSFSFAQIFHLYFNSVPGQKIMDYSSGIFDYAYAVNWSDLEPKTRKLLILIMLRSLKPCKITAGKVYIVSMESYSAVMQTSMSYFTVLSSML